MGMCCRTAPLIIGIIIPTNIPGVTVLEMSHVIIAIHTTVPRVRALKNIPLVIAVNVPACHLSRIVLKKCPIND